ncbi:PD-(D/E)XK nuclease family protein [Anaerovibrio sp. RM50]|uniref:PD-(D/E)XK nuclease family protein n=1 Tax=Anaerovibrio sp. RM50 TaxID=1200557 RepID=UPI000485DD34|nr:PD-(D/E)XK nuclease family protein [Anaerovibrio sp. RM50]
MGETIIFAPGANGRELLRSLARFGEKCFNIRACGSAELAELVLMRAGIVLDKNRIDYSGELALMAEAVKKGDKDKYFKYLSYSDLSEITKSMDQMRMMAEGENESELLSQGLKKGIFTEKNNTLIKIYQEYMKLLNKSGVDLVELVRQAAQVDAATVQNAFKDTRFIKLGEYPLMPLEEKLLSLISGGKYELLQLKDLFSVERADAAATKNTYYSCYGAANEVEQALEEIYRNHNLEDCTIAVTDPGQMSQLIYDYVQLYDIPCTFDTGVPISNSNPARLLKLYQTWMTSGYYGVDALNSLIFSDYFDRQKFIGEILKGVKTEKLKGTRLLTSKEKLNLAVLTEMAGQLRLSSDSTVNKELIKNFKSHVAVEKKYGEAKDSKNYKDWLTVQQALPLLKNAASELSLPLAEFITKYSRIRYVGDSNGEKFNTLLDQTALKAICRQLESRTAVGLDENLGECINGILSSRAGRSDSQPGKLHVTTMEGALCTIRPHLYILGLSATKYPGAARENYLLLDDDLDNLANGNNQGEWQKSQGKVQLKLDRLLGLVDTMHKLKGNVVISYSAYNVAELKKENPSSIVYKIHEKEQGGAHEIPFEEIAYFKPAISINRGIGAAYVGDKEITRESNEWSQGHSEPVSYTLQGEYSPSNLEKFFKCPKKYLFEKLMGLEAGEDTDAFEILSNKDKGNLAHKLMEILGAYRMEHQNQLMDNGDFMEHCGEIFDSFIKSHTALVPTQVSKVRADFMAMMADAYFGEKAGTDSSINMMEKKLQGETPEGIKLGGYPDRVECQDGDYKIVDFKTGKADNYKDNNVAKCLQVMIYAYILEQTISNAKISGGEYRFLAKKNKIISCGYNEDAKSTLLEALSKFKEHMEQGNFPCEPLLEGLKEDCEYCGYADICGKDNGGCAEDE